MARRRRGTERAADDASLSAAVAVVGETGDAEEGGKTVAMVTDGGGNEYSRVPDCPPGVPPSNVAIHGCALRCNPDGTREEERPQRALPSPSLLVLVRRLLLLVPPRGSWLAWTTTGPPVVLVFSFHCTGMSKKLA